MARASAKQAAPTRPGDYCLMGFSIRPSQILLLTHDKEALQRDLVGLLSALTYHPQHIEKVTLDLRYLISLDDSLARRHFDIVLLVRIDLKPDEEYDRASVEARFRSDIFNLLTLYLGEHEILVEPLQNKQLEEVRCPFVPSDCVEITRRITDESPWKFSELDGKSSMTRIIDMMLRESDP